MRFYLSRRIALALCLVVILSLVVNLGQNNTAQAALHQPRIVFIENGNLYFATYNTVNLNNVQRTALIAHGNAESADWSPDGNRISYVERDGDKASLFILNSDGINPKFVGNSYAAYWSPDSSKLAFTNKDGVFVVNADGSGVKQVLSGNYEFGQMGWAPSSSKLIAAKDATPNVLDDLKMEAYTVNADGSNAAKAFNFTGRLYGYWPDGQRIVFGSAPDDASDIRLGAYSLTLIKPDGTQRQPLQNTTGSRHKLILAPSGDKVLIGPGITIQSPTSDWSVAGVANPVATFKPLRLSGQDYIIAADWSVVPGYIYAVVQSGNQKRLESIEVNQPTNRRVIINIGPETPNKPPVAQPYDYTVSTEGNGLILFKEVFGSSYLLDANKGTAYTGFAGQLRPNFYVDALPEFYNVWYRADAYITTYQSSASWLWGPTAFAAKTEDYAEAKGGKRQVQYFDKARMELTNPEGDRGNAFFVTNGLLPKELIGGYIQTGDNATQPKAPAEINVAGDPNGSVTYAKLASVTTLSPGQNTAPNRTGQPVTAAIDRTGTVTQTQAMPGVTLTKYVAETGHNIPNVFDNYFVTLPQDWVFVMGYPISEPYQTEVTLMGKPTKVLVQVFERRVLTYTPTNVAPYMVEQGNVGRHYYEWRYGN